MQNLIIVALLVVLSSCGSKPVGAQPEATEGYRFFVAGHVYGQPGVDNDGVYPPFKQYGFPAIQFYQDMAFGFFTGDIVLSSSEKNWNEIDTDIDSIGLPVYFAPGNHDGCHYSPYKERYGEPAQYFFHQGDLFIILDVNHYGWNVPEEQLDMIDEALTQLEPHAHVFVMVHQVIWYEEGGEFAEAKPNSMDGRQDSLNFYTEVAPRFSKLPNEVYFFAGDVGAKHKEPAYSAYEYQGIHLYTSGMGGDWYDNFLVVEVGESVKVSSRWLSEW